MGRPFDKALADEIRNVCNRLKQPVRGKDVFVMDLALDDCLRESPAAQLGALLDVMPAGVQECAERLAQELAIDGNLLHSEPGRYVSPPDEVCKALEAWARARE